MKNLEFVIWGIPEGKQDEELLFTNSESLEEAKKVVKVLTEKYKCAKCRIQIIDLNKPISDNDFIQAFL